MTLAWRAVLLSTVLVVGATACGRGGDDDAGSTTQTTAGAVMEELDGSEADVIPADGDTKGDLPAGCGGLTASIVGQVIGAQVSATATPDAKTCTFAGDGQTVAVFAAPGDTPQPGTSLPQLAGATYLPEANRVVVKAGDQVWFIGLDGGGLAPDARKTALVTLADLVEQANN